MLAVTGLHFCEALSLRPGGYGFPERTRKPGSEGILTIRGAHNLIVWQGGDTKECLLTYDRERRLVRMDYPDGTRFLIEYPEQEPPKGLEMDAGGDTRARLRLDAAGLACTRLDPEGARSWPAAEPPKGLPGLEFFLKKAAENRARAAGAGTALQRLPSRSRLAA